MRAAIKLLLALSLAGCPAPVGDVPPWEGSGYAPLAPARAGADGWRTAFDRAAIPLSEVFSADLARDAILAIDAPSFDPVDAVSLEAGDPVAVLGERAYPLSVLLHHELVNDVVDGLPVAVTYCSLCDSTLAYDRTLEGHVLSLGVSGFLRRGNALLYDRRTESLWQQLTGEALVGEHTGARLTRVAVAVVSFGTFRASFPDGRVLRAPSGVPPRVRVPAPGYEDGVPTHLFVPPDPRFGAMARVLGVELRPGVCRAAPLAAGSVPAALGPGVVLADAATRSVFGSAGAPGSAALFSPVVGGRALHFEAHATGIRDRQTGSTWSALGVALDGPLVGHRLEPLVAIPALWHALAAHLEVTLD